MDRYTVISADCHGGGAIADYRPYLPSTLHDDFDAWRAAFDNPYDDLEGDDGRPQLGQRPPPAPSSRPTASSPRSSSRTRSRRSSRRPRSCTSRRRPTPATSPCAGTGCGPTTAGSPTSARRRPGRRAGIAQILLHDVDAAVAEVRWAAGRRADRRRAAARHAARVGPAAAVRARLRAALGGVRGARRCRQPPHRQRVARLRRLPRGQGDVPRRGDVVGAPRAVAARSTPA